MTYTMCYYCKIDFLKEQIDRLKTDKSRKCEKCCFTFFIEQNTTQNYSPAMNV